MILILFKIAATLCIMSAATGFSMVLVDSKKEHLKKKIDDIATKMFVSGLMVGLLASIIVVWRIVF